MAVDGAAVKEKDEGSQLKSYRRKSPFLNVTTDSPKRVVSMTNSAEQKNLTNLLKQINKKYNEANTESPRTRNGKTVKAIQQVNLKYNIIKMNEDLLLNRITREYKET